MPITQIPFQDPVAPPEKPQPEQLGLYDARDWEEAYREPDDHRVPHLLIQLQDDLARSRWREAVWISIIVHLLLAIGVWNFAFLASHLLGRKIIAFTPSDLANRNNVTFLALPPDLQKAPHKPNTNVISDKDRIAMTRHPELDAKDLRKVLATPPPGRSGSAGPRTPEPAPQAPQMAQNQPQNLQQAIPQQPPSENQTAQLQTPRANSNPFKMGGSAGDAIQEAARAAADRRGGGGGGQEGDFGLGTGAHGRQQGALEILSDTQGVDFGPYLQRILQDVRENWYRLIPESAQMKKGKLAIEFAITKDGQVAGMKLVATSGDTALDRAAWGGITASNPFPPLPTDFGGPYLALRFRFYYNPAKGELE
jgi:TonB family protein